MSKKKSTLDKELDKCISFQNFMHQDIKDSRIVKRFFKLYRKFVDIVSYAKLMMFPTDKLTPTSIKKAVLVIATPVGIDDDEETLLRIQEVKIDDDNILKVYDKLKKKYRSSLKSLSKKEKHSLIEEYIIQEVKEMRDQIARMREVDSSSLLIDTIGEITWTEFEQRFEKKYNYKPTAFSFSTWSEYSVVRVDTRKVDFVFEDDLVNDDLDLQNGAKEPQGLSMEQLVAPEPGMDRLPVIPILEEQEETYEPEENLNQSVTPTYIVQGLDEDYRGTGKPFSHYMFSTNDDFILGRGEIEQQDADKQEFKPIIPQLPESFDVDAVLNEITESQKPQNAFASQRGLVEELLSMGVPAPTAPVVEEPKAAPETEFNASDELLSMGVPVPSAPVVEEPKEAPETEFNASDELLSMGVPAPTAPVVEEPKEAPETEFSASDELLSMGVPAPTAPVVEEPKAAPVTEFNVSDELLSMGVPAPTAPEAEESNDEKDTGLSVEELLAMGIPVPSTPVVEEAVQRDDETNKVEQDQVAVPPIFEQLRDSSLPISFVEEEQKDVVPTEDAQEEILPVEQPSAVSEDEVEEDVPQTEEQEDVVPTEDAQEEILPVEQPSAASEDELEEDVPQTEEQEAAVPTEEVKEDTEQLMQENETQELVTPVEVLNLLRGFGKDFESENESSNDIQEDVAQVEEQEDVVSTEEVKEDTEEEIAPEQKMTSAEVLEILRGFDDDFKPENESSDDIKEDVPQIEEKEDVASAEDTQEEILPVEQPSADEEVEQETATQAEIIDLIDRLGGDLEQQTELTDEVVEDAPQKEEPETTEEEILPVIQPIHELPIEDEEEQVESKTPMTKEEIDDLIQSIKDEKSQSSEENEEKTQNTESSIKLLTKEEIDEIVESIKREKAEKTVDEDRPKTKYDFYSVDQLIAEIEAEKKAKEANDKKDKEELEEQEKLENEHQEIETRTPKKVRVMKKNLRTGEIEILTEKPKFIK